MNASLTAVRFARGEIRRLFPRTLMVSLVVSITLHFMLLGMYYAGRALSTEEEGAVMRVRIIRYSELAPPPSIANDRQVPVVGISVASSRPRLGIPVPVPDLEIDPGITIPTQKELSASDAPSSEDGTGEGGAGVRIVDDTPKDIVIEEDDPDINAFIPVEKAPQIVKAVKPLYPDIARLSEIEGIVWVKVLSDKTGRPKKAVIISETANGVFNQAAVDAAMQYRFTPAAMSAGPVQVWAAIKFGFKLREAL